jgi:hypothetical protein
VAEEVAGEHKWSSTERHILEPRISDLARSLGLKARLLNRDMQVRLKRIPDAADYAAAFQVFLDQFNQKHTVADSQADGFKE